MKSFKLKQGCVVDLWVAAAVICLFIGGCRAFSVRNVTEIKAHASDFWSAAGFEVISYEGYRGALFETSGGQVWYIVRQKHGVPTLYEAALARWDGEYHIYNFHAIDAVRPPEE